MSSHSEIEDLGFDEITQEKLSRLFTRITYNYINHTNRAVKGSKIRAADIKNFNDEEWKQFYQDHIENFKLICTDYLKSDFVVVEVKKSKTNNSLLATLREVIIAELSQEAENESNIEEPESASCKEISVDGQSLVYVEHETTTEGQRKELVPKILGLDSDEQENLDGNEELGYEFVYPLREQFHSCRNDVDTEQSLEQHQVSRKNSEPPELNLDVNDVEFPNLILTKENPIADLFSNMLDSLKRPETSPEPSERQEQKSELENAFMTIAKDLHQLCSDANEFRENIKEKLSPTNDIGIAKLTEEVPDEPDPDFAQKLQDQIKTNKERLEQAKLQREEKQKEHQAELQSIREQQKQCFMALMVCIQLKTRFEEKEQEVSAWIDACYRKPVLGLLRRFGEFEDMAREWNFFKKDIQEEDSRNEVYYLHKKVYLLLETLKSSFDQLTQLSQMSSEAVFLKVLQKHICDHAEALYSVLDVLEEHRFDNEWYRKLEQSFWNIKPEKIPTTKRLQKICQKIDEMEYMDLKFPERSIQSSVVIEEELDDLQEPEELKNFQCSRLYQENQTQLNSRNRRSRKRSSSPSKEPCAHLERKHCHTKLVQ